MITTLADFGFQYGDDGIVINGDNNTAPYLDIKTVDGLDNVPLKVNSKDYDGRDGGIYQAEFEQMRTVVITGEIHGGDVDAAPIEPLLDSLKYNFAPTAYPKPLYIHPHGVAIRQIFCKSGGFHYSWEAMRRWNSSPFSITLVAEDPTIYGIETRITPGILTQPNPGHGFNYAFDYSFGGINAPTITPVINYGNKPVGFIARFPTGMSVTNPKLYSVTAGRILTLKMQKSSAEELVIDFYNQTVRVDEASRRKSVDLEGWFLLQPGQNWIQYSSDDAVPNGAMQFEALDGYR